MCNRSSPIYTTYNKMNKLFRQILRTLKHTHTHREHWNVQSEPREPTDLYVTEANNITSPTKWQSVGNGFCFFRSKLCFPCVCESVCLVVCVCVCLRYAFSQCRTHKWGWIRVVGVWGELNKDKLFEKLGRLHSLATCATPACCIKRACCCHRGCLSFSV